MKIRVSKAIGGMASLLIMASIPSGASASVQCFPPEVLRGVVLEGREINYKVLEVNGCWVKAVICPQPDNCRDTPYWVHATFIEAFKARK